MKLAVSSVIPVARERVFDALVDPEILRRCIPGCETLTTIGPDSYEATLKIGVAGLKGTYTGKAAVREKQPPESLTLSFEGKGGPGFVRGSAAIALSPQNNVTDVNRATAIACAADVQVGGLIAAVGSRLVEAAAKKLADDFFRQLSAELLKSET